MTWPFDSRVQRALKRDEALAMELGSRAYVALCWWAWKFPKVERGDWRVT